MCFKNLPIEFDSAGRATLVGGARDPFAYERKDISRDEIRKLMEQNGFVKAQSDSTLRSALIIFESFSRGAETKRRLTALLLEPRDTSPGGVGLM